MKRCSICDQKCDLCRPCVDLKRRHDLETRAHVAKQRGMRFGLLVPVEGEMRRIKLTQFHIMSVDYRNPESWHKTDKIVYSAMFIKSPTVNPRANRLAAKLGVFAGEMRGDVVFTGPTGHTLLESEIKAFILLLHYNETSKMRENLVTTNRSPQNPDSRICCDNQPNLLQA